MSPGLLCAALRGLEPPAALTLAAAAGVLKQTIPGDINRVTIEEVERLSSGEAGGRLRR